VAQNLREKDGRGRSVVYIYILLKKKKILTPSLTLLYPHHTAHTLTLHNLYDHVLLPRELLLGSGQLLLKQLVVADQCFLCG
jgi:hypothetical protein